MKKVSITAKLILINVQLFSIEKKKEYSRFRLSKDTLRRLSGRERIRDAYIEELVDEFELLGWHFFSYTDTEFGMIKLDKVGVWAKIGSSRVLKLLGGDEAAVDAEYALLFGDDDLPALGDD